MPANAYCAEYTALSINQDLLLFCAMLLMTDDMLCSAACHASSHVTHSTSHATSCTSQVTRRKSHVKRQTSPAAAHSWFHRLTLQDPCPLAPSVTSIFRSQCASQYLNTSRQYTKSVSILGDGVRPRAAAVELTLFASSSPTFWRQNFKPSFATVHCRTVDTEGTSSGTDDDDTACENARENEERVGGGRE